MTLFDVFRMLFGLSAYGHTPEDETLATWLCLLVGLVVGFVSGWAVSP